MKKYRLKPEELKSCCNEKILEFETTKELEPLYGMIGQDRAAKALDFGINVKKRGYNIYVSGTWGTGRNSYVKLVAEEKAKKLPKPKDWLYVYNFKNPRIPTAIDLEAGLGKEFVKDMERNHDFLETEIDNVFSGKDYENTKALLVQEYNKETANIIEQLNELGVKYSFRFSQSDKGLVSIPLKDGEVMSEEEYRSLSEEEYEVLKNNSAQLSVESADVFSVLKKEEEKLQNKLQDLDEKMGHRVVSFHLMSIREKYRNNEKVVKYLDDLLIDIVDHIGKFKKEDEPDEGNPLAMLQGAPKTDNFFKRYEVNLFVDNSDKEYAPVIYETNPTFSNLIGNIEFVNEFGVLKTDFTHIKSGALHQANGGFLVIQTRDLLTAPYAWKALKRAMINKEVLIESISERSNSIVSSSQRPEPIPLDVKVIIIGDSYSYHMLYNYDEEFRKLFKVMADFDNEIPRSDDNVLKMARFIATHSINGEMKHFTKDAVYEVLNYSTRMADNQDKISSHLNQIVDLVFEADVWAGLDGEELVHSAHVFKALEEQKHRSNKYEEKVHDMFEEGTYLLDVKGKKIGEINGLAVVGAGQYSFGKPSKITVSTYKGKSGIINIEREARTSGSLHDKGILILTGYLGHKYAQDKPLALTASVVFEQLYSGVDGDSASSTELYAILSSLANVAINQGIAVTGSVNQRGEIQPIGGVNEKIEGFFRVCQLKGWTGKQGVMIPYLNKKNLMLSKEIIEAVEAGEFSIYAIEHIDQGIEILTGVKAGKPDKEGHYKEGTIHDLVNKKLVHLARPAMKRHDDDSDKDKEE